MLFTPKYNVQYQDGIPQVPKGYEYAVNPNTLEPYYKRTNPDFATTWMGMPSSIPIPQEIKDYTQPNIMFDNGVGGFVPATGAYIQNPLPTNLTNPVQTADYGINTIWGKQDLNKVFSGLNPDALSRALLGQYQSNAIRQQAEEGYGRGIGYRDYLANQLSGSNADVLGTAQNLYNQGRLGAARALSGTGDVYNQALYGSANILGQAGSIYDQARQAMNQALTQRTKSVFEQMNPQILESLNSRGLLTSPEAVSKAQADVIGQLESENQARLADFEAQVAGARSGDLRYLADIESQRAGSQIQNLRDQAQYERDVAASQVQSMSGLEKERIARMLGLDLTLFQGREDMLDNALTTLLQSQQTALDLNTAFKNQAFDAALQKSLANQEAQSAYNIAAKQSRNQLLGSILGGGMQILGGLFG